MRFVLTLVLLLAPSLALAVTAPTDFRDVVALILSYIGLIVPIIFALTFVVFIWGLAKALILNGGDEHSIEEGKAIALWGVIGLVVMTGLWGILALLRTSFFGI